MGFLTKRSSVHFKRDNRGRVVEVVHEGDIGKDFDDDPQFSRLMTADDLIRQYNQKQKTVKPVKKRGLLNIKMSAKDFQQIFGFQPYAPIPMRMPVKRHVPSVAVRKVGNGWSVFVDNNQVTPPTVKKYADNQAKIIKSRFKGVK